MRGRATFSILAVALMAGWGSTDHADLRDVVPIAATMTLGSTSIGTLGDTAGAGYKFGSIYSLSQAGTTVSFNWYTKGGNATQRMTPVVYGVNTSGNPSSVLATGAEVQVVANQPAGWVTSTLPSVTLSPGSYMLALLSGPTGGRAVNYSNAVTNGGMWNANAYPNPSSTWGQVNRENAQWSFYVTLNPTGAPQAPVNQAPPALTGTATVGATLTATQGTWTNNPTSYAYQWSRCQGVCAQIAGATAATYTITGADAGFSLRVAVTATNAGGSTTAQSAQTAVVPTPPQAPVNQAPPALTGTATVGATLTATQGTWSGTPTPTLTQRWQRCSGTCTDIAGATATTYTVASADVGSQLQVVVVATNSAGTAQATSIRTSVVTTAPTVGVFGSTTPGGQADLPGSNFKFGTVYALSTAATLVDFNWYTRGGTVAQSFVPALYNTDASGNPTSLVTTGAAVTITANKAPGWVTSALPAGITLPPGNYLLALVSGPSGSKAFVYYDAVPNSGVWNGNAYPNPSSTWGPVNRDEGRWSFYIRYQGNTPASPPTNQAPPAVTGSPVAGQNLVASTGTWTNNPTSFGYQWHRCQDGTCVAMAGATASSYALAAADIGSRLKVAVTAANSAGSAIATSVETAPVSAPGNLTIQPFTKYVIDGGVPGAIIEKAVGDLDGDGRLDVVIGTESSSTQSGGGVYWYEFPHSGNPADPWTKRTILPTGTAYEDMTTFDVDGDSRVDVVAAVNGNLYWFKNPSSVGGSWAQNLIGGIRGESSLAVADLDGDGRLDIATNAYIFFQDSPTAWVRLQLGSSFMGVALLDSGSGQGRIDLAGNDHNAPYGVVWYENPRDRGGNARNAAAWLRHHVGAGYPCSGGLAQCPEGTIAALQTGDLNGDGRMDIVVGQSEGEPPPPGGLKWFEAPVDRTTSWIGHTIDATVENTHNIRTADIDGNGALDIVTGEQDQSAQDRVTVFYNDGSGNFTLQVLSTDATHNVAVGDLDRDGDVDVVASPHGYYGDPHPLQLYVNGRF